MMCFLHLGGLQSAKVGADGTGQFALKIDEADLSTLTATIRYPSGKEEPCSLKRLDNGQLGEQTIDIS